MITILIWMCSKRWDGARNVEWKFPIVADTWRLILARRHGMQERAIRRTSLFIDTKRCVARRTDVFMLGWDIWCSVLQAAYRNEPRFFRRNLAVYFCVGVWYFNIFNWMLVFLNEKWVKFFIIFLGLCQLVAVEGWKQFFNSWKGVSDDIFFARYVSYIGCELANEIEMPKLTWRAFFWFLWKECFLPVVQIGSNSQSYAEYLACAELEMRAWNEIETWNTKDTSGSHEPLMYCCSVPPMDMPDASLIIASGASYAGCNKRMAFASFDLQAANACEMFSVQTIESLPFIFSCTMAFMVFEFRQPSEWIFWQKLILPRNYQHFLAVVGLLYVRIALTLVLCENVPLAVMW